MRPAHSASAPDGRIIAIAVGTVAVSYIPYLVGWLRQTDSLVFSGLLFNPIDANAYLAVMQQGWRGAWLLTLPYSSEPHSPLFLYEFYLLLGRLCSLLRLSPPVGYHLARGLGGLWLLLAAYDFLRVHLRRAATRRVAFVFICVSAGLGWLLQVVSPADASGVSAIDFWLMDAYAFFSLLLVPHFTVAGALGLTLLTSISRAAYSAAGFEALAGHSAAGDVGVPVNPTARNPFSFRKRVSAPARQAAAAFGSGLGLAVIHPKALPAFAGVAFVWAVVLAWPRAGRRGPVLAVLALGGLGAMIPALYYAYQYLTNPVFVTLARQDITMSPAIQHYLFGYGVLTPLAVVGAVRVWRRGAGPERLLLIWPVVVVLLLYAPTQIQRRFVLGLQVPVAALAAMGLVEVALPVLGRSRAARALGRVYSHRRLRLLALNLTIAVSLFTNALLLAGYTWSAWARSPAMFVPGAVAAAADWLGVTAAATDFTLSSYPTGNYLPARSGAPAFIGHWNLTLDFYPKEALVARIYDGATGAAERERLIRATGVRYVFHGPDERDLGAFDPAAAPYLAERFRSGDVAVYEVLPQ